MTAPDDKDSVAFWYEKHRQLELTLLGYRSAIRLAMVGYLLIIIVWLVW